MEFETKRLILRPWTIEDANDLYQFASDPEVGPITGWAPHQSAEESRTIIQTVLSGEYDFAVVLKETDQVIGSVSLMNCDSSRFAASENVLEIGCWIGVPFWGRGLMVEAFETLFDYAFDRLNLERIYAGYFEGNEKSRRLQEKCGMKYVRTCENVPCAIEGLFRTQYITCIDRDEWNCRRQSRI